MGKAPRNLNTPTQKAALGQKTPRHHKTQRRKNAHNRQTPQRLKGRAQKKCAQAHNAPAENIGGDIQGGIQKPSLQARHLRLARLLLPAIRAKAPAAPRALFDFPKPEVPPMAFAYAPSGGAKLTAVLAGWAGPLLHLRAARLVARRALSDACPEVRAVFLSVTGLRQGAPRPSRRRLRCLRWSQPDRLRSSLRLPPRAAFLL